MKLEHTIGKCSFKLEVKYGSLFYFLFYITSQMVQEGSYYWTGTCNQYRRNNLDIF